ncbi:MAG: hypothetical protein O7E52_24725 [Candidatus Poribacteria bacterium]|nr:hypothetical protein [Candidatus Poribacteria bacterium]
MSVQVKLMDIIEGMEFQSDQSYAYLNRKIGEVVTLTDEHVSSSGALPL